jgi:hypothetical protein
MSRERAKQIRITADAWFASIYGYAPGPIPAEGDSTVPNYVDALWKDSKDWRIRSFDNRMEYNDPFEFWRDARRLETGLHWEVWGKRNAGDEDKWKQEIVDDEISNQIRVRKSYLTANWHDISVLPNLKNFTTILDQERGKTKWGDKMIQTVHRGLNEGMACLKTILDRTVDPDGLANEILIDNAGIFPTPYSYGINKLDGTWYLIHAELQSVQQIKNEFPHADDIQFDQVQEEIAKYLRIDLDTTTPQTYVHTKLVPVMRLYMDDPKSVRAPHDQEQIDLEHQALQNGHDPQVDDVDNHVEHVKQHLDWLDAMHQTEPQDSKEAELRDAQTELMAMHVEDHHKAVQKKRMLGLSPGVYQKYPLGRIITVAGGVLMDDRPNPFPMDWRKLFHFWYCEKLPNSWWGRGVPEILWNTNRVEDTMLSRTADIALTVGMPKQYFDIQDKDNVETQGINNDPLQPGFVSKPPVFRTGQAPRENMEIYQAMKTNAQKTQAVSGVNYGQAQNAQQSGKLVETLLQQSQVIISGEANQRLNETIEEIIEARIELYKVAYKEPRFYFINGQPQAIVLSDLLSKWNVVTPGGEMKEQEIPAFSITVRPNSNFPQRFEYQLAFLLQLAQTPSPDGTPLVPREAILDIVANLYPQLGRDGEYYKMSEALKIGMQVIAQQEQKQKEDQKTMKNIAGKIRNKGINELLNKGNLQGGDNGGAESGSPGGAGSPGNG